MARFLQTTLISVCLTLLPAFPVLGHELWLEPLDYRIDPGDALRAHIKVGQYFKGDTYSYVPHRFRAFDLRQGDATEPVAGRLGNRPAVDQTMDRPGLTVLTYETEYRELTYGDSETFRNFLKLDGLQWVARRHRERDLPSSGFTEVYRRFAKAYVEVGHGRGEDRIVGFPIEWVLAANPYSLAPGQTLQARLLWQGEPFSGSLVRVFTRSGGGEVEEHRLTTDAEGRVTLPYRADSEYLVSSVHMIEPSAGVAEEYGAVWESLWASAVFYRE